MMNYGKNINFTDKSNIIVITKLFFDKKQGTTKRLAKATHSKHL